MKAPPATKARVHGLMLRYTNLLSYWIMLGDPNRYTEVEQKRPNLFE